MRNIFEAFKQKFQLKEFWTKQQVLRELDSMYLQLMELALEKINEKS
jgi:hypothetical protein